MHIRELTLFRCATFVFASAVREYAYIEKGGTSASSSALGVSEHAIIKTLLFQESDDSTPFIVLQHGDASVDTKKLVKELARTRGRTSGPSGDGVDPITAASKKPRAFMTSPETAQQHTGYQVGGTSPFGVQDRSVRVFIEASLLKLRPAPAPTTVQPSKPADVARRDEEAARWDDQIAENETLVDFSQLDTPRAKAALLDLVSPAWVLLNGGARGTLVALSVRDIVRVLRPIVISVGKVQGAEGEEKGATGGKKSQQAQQKAAAAAVEAEAAQ